MAFKLFCVSFLWSVLYNPQDFCSDQMRIKLTVQREVLKKCEKCIPQVFCFLLILSPIFLGKVNQSIQSQQGDSDILTQPLWLSMLPCQGEFQVSRSRIGATESGATVSSLYFSVEQRDFAETYLDLDKQQSSFSFQKEQKRKKNPIQLR